MCRRKFQPCQPLFYRFINDCKADIRLLLIFAQPESDAFLHLCERFIIKIARAAVRVHVGDCPPVGIAGQQVLRIVQLYQPE